MSKDLTVVKEGPHLPKRLEPLVHYFKDNSPLELEPVEDGGEGVDLRHLPLVTTEPVRVEVAGRIFELADEGLYRPSRLGRAWVRPPQKSHAERPMLVVRAGRDIKGLTATVSDLKHAKAQATIGSSASQPK